MSFTLCLLLFPTRTMAVARVYLFYILHFDIEMTMCWFNQSAIELRCKIRWFLSLQLCKSPRLGNSCRTYMMPDFMLSSAIPTFGFVCLTFVCGVCWWFATLTAVLLLFALFCSVIIMAAVITLRNLKLWCIFFRRVQEIVDIKPMSYASVSCVWIRGENNDGLMFGILFDALSTEGSDFDDWHRVLSFHAFNDGFIVGVN